MQVVQPPPAVQAPPNSAPDASSSSLVPSPLEWPPSWTPEPPSFWAQPAVWILLLLALIVTGISVVHRRRTQHARLAASRARDQATNPAHAQLVTALAAMDRDDAGKRSQHRTLAQAVHAALQSLPARRPASQAEGPGFDRLADWSETLRFGKQDGVTTELSAALRNSVAELLRQLENSASLQEPQNG